MFISFSISQLDNYNFEDYKIENYNGIIIASELEHSCSWKPDSINDGYKVCNPEVIIWNRRTYPIPINLIKNNIDLSITRAYKNNKLNIFYSTNYEIYEETKTNSTCNRENNCNYNVSKIRFTNWKEFDGSQKNIPANTLIGVRLNFELPQYNSASWNFTYTPLNFILDPDISDCGTLSTDGATYTLTDDITNSASTTCMDVTGDNITLDCQNHLIDGTDASISRGIEQGSANTNLTVKNCNLTDWFAGIETGKNSTITDTRISSTTNYGILMNGENVNISNVNISENTRYGIYFSSSGFSNVENSYLINNAFADAFIVYSAVSTRCDNTLNNVTGTDYKPIFYYNDTVTIEHWDNNVSQIILCGASNSVINNITLNHTGINRNNPLLITATDNMVIENSTFRNLDTGIYLYGSNNNEIRNVYIEDSDWYGIYIRNDADGNLVENTTILDADLTGIYMGSISDNNIIRDSKISESGGQGIDFDIAPTNNQIYNNLLNNTDNVDFSQSEVYNSWNTTKQSGTNILNTNNIYIGGNYYTNSSSTGFSDTCEDSNLDGFCDFPYNISTDSPCTEGVNCSSLNADFLPLSDEFSLYIEIDYPENGSYLNYNVSLNLNFTYINNSAMDTCLFTTDDYTTNTTITNCENITFNISEGNYLLVLWANNSDGDNSTDSTNFTVDLTNPTMNITSPLNDSIDLLLDQNINYTSLDTYLQSCWYSNDSMTENISITCGNNITTIEWIIGQHNITIWGNDSAGNENSSTITFTIDNIEPLISNISISTTSGSQTISFSFNASDTNLDSCWYSVFNSSGGIDQSTTENTSVNCNSEGNSETVSIFATYNLTIYANDSAGNENSSTQEFTVSQAVTGGGGGGGGVFESSTICIKDTNISLMSELRRCIIYARIREKCNGRRCLLNIDEKNELLGTLSEQNVDITIEELNRWIDSYNRDDLEVLKIADSEINRYNLFTDIIQVDVLAFLPSPSNLAPFSLITSENATFTFPIRFNRIIKNASMLEGSSSALSLEITSESTINVFLKPTSTDFITRIYEGTVLTVSEDEETTFLPITIRAIAINQTTILIFFAIIIVFIVIIINRRELNKKLKKVLKTFR